MVTDWLYVLAVFTLASLAHSQITYIITQGVIFKEVREWAHQKSPRLGYLCSCFLCAGTWVGFGMGLMMTMILRVTSLPWLDFLLFSFGVAFISCVFNEMRAILREHVCLLEERTSAERAKLREIDTRIAGMHFQREAAEQEMYRKNQEAVRDAALMREAQHRMGGDMSAAQQVQAERVFSNPDVVSSFLSGMLRNDRSHLRPVERAEAFGDGYDDDPMRIADEDNKDGD